jgi:1,2-diacylglycerol 3-beta-glucosyltransferase
VFAWILWPIGAYIAVVSVYMMAVVVGAWCYRPVCGSPLHNPRIAVIVPAHDEGGRLIRTLQDLRSCDYPLGFMQVFVVADNCNDGTADIARAQGAIVFERTAPSERGKGPALDWVLKSRQEVLCAFDIIAFVDADMFVDAQFAKIIGNVFADAGVVAIQARNTVANPTDSWLAAFGFMSFAYVNHVRPAGRCFLGGSASLKGSGMAFRSNLILQTGWPTHSIAEDLDFAKELTLRGVRIHYVPAAIVTSNIASRMEQVQVQQARWEGGKHQALVTFLPRMLHAFARQPSLLLLDEILDLLVPPLSQVVLLLLMVAVPASLLGSPPLWLIVSCIAIFAVAVVTGLVQLRAPVKTLLYIAMAPVFILMKLLIFVRLALGKKQSEWKRTPRDGEEL